MSEEFDERQYWPSKWSKRLSEDVICAIHSQITTEEFEKDATIDFLVDTGHDKSIVHSKKHRILWVCPLWSSRGRKKTNKNKETILSEGNIQYGDSPTQVMDVYGKDLPSEAPWFVFIHGGYWVEYTKDCSAYCAKPLWASGVRVCVPDYDLAPKATMTEIVRQMQNMARHVLERALKEGSRRVWICGHSAGAHLAARLLDENWLSSLTPESRQLFKGVFLIGGVYDLKPIIKLSEVNDVLKMTENEAKSHSPINTVTNFKTKSLVNTNFKTVIVVAENESEAFQQQSQKYFKALNEEGMEAEYLFLPGLDHFDVVENLRTSTFDLTKKICQEINGS